MDKLGISEYKDKLCADLGITKLEYLKDMDLEMADEVGMSDVHQAYFAHACVATKHAPDWMKEKLGQP